MAGLDPDQQFANCAVRITSAVGSTEQARIYPGSLWLVSNVPSVKEPQFLIDLNPGLPFLDTERLPDPEFHRPSVGLRALRRAGLKIEIDFARDTVSVWTPDA